MDYLRLANSTVAFNIAEFYGGVSILEGTAIIEFSTLVENNNTSSSSNHFHGGTTEIRNSIIAKNDGDCSVYSGASVTASGVNLHFDGTCPGFTLMASPALGPLADNGGPTITMAPMTGSPVIDAVPHEDCTWVDGRSTPNDQRDFSRPQGAGCEIGAVEWEFSSAPIPPPPMPETPPPTQPPYACVELLGISMRKDGTMRIQLETSGVPDGEYEAEVGKDDFTCKTYRDYPDRLFCDGPQRNWGFLATLKIFDASGAVFCEETFTIPEPEKPETKEPGGGVDCTKYGSDYSSCSADPACKWSDSEYKCFNK
jgi:hypothetical protein